jgi:hypothetical protein
MVYGGPSSPLFNGYRVFTLDSNGRGLKLTTHLHLLSRYVGYTWTLVIVSVVLKPGICTAGEEPPGVGVGAMEKIEFNRLSLPRGI